MHHKEGTIATLDEVLKHSIANWIATTNNYSSAKANVGKDLGTDMYI